MYDVIGQSTMVIKSSDPHLNFSCKKDDICMYQKVLKNGFIVKLA